MLLSSGIVWLAATCVFVVLHLINPAWAGWLAFVYAVFANAILLIVYAGVWKYRLLGFFSVSTLIWVSLACVYLTVKVVCDAVGASYDGLWCLFLLGVPLQALEILWVFFRSLFGKHKEKQAALSQKRAQKLSEKKAEEEVKETQNG